MKSEGHAIMYVHSTGSRGYCTCAHTSLAASRSHFLAELAFVSVSRVVKVCREEKHVYSVQNKLFHNVKNDLI